MMYRVWGLYGDQITTHILVKQENQTEKTMKSDITTGSYIGAYTELRHSEFAGIISSMPHVLKLLGRF